MAGCPKSQREPAGRDSQVRVVFPCRPDSAGTGSVFVGLWLFELADLPDEVGELAGERDHDHVAGFTALEA